MEKEKYILVPESEWENNYKKQQDIIKDLRYELKHRNITIHVHRSYGFGHVGLDNIGVFEVRIDGAYQIKDFDKKHFLQSIKSDYGIDLSKSKEEDRLKIASAKIKSIPKIVRWLFKINP